jgi:hypothetical protein
MKNIESWDIAGPNSLACEWEHASQLAIRIKAHADGFTIECFSDVGNLAARDEVPFNTETRAGLFRRAHALLQDSIGERVYGPWDGAVDQSDNAKEILDTIKSRAVRARKRERTVPTRARTRTPSQESPSTMTDNTFNDPTLNMFMRVGAHSSKVVASAQAMKICRKIAEKIARKYLPEEHHALLDTKGGAIIVDLITPGVVHALASRQMLPGSEYLEPMSEYALEGSIVRHGLDLTDMAADLMMDLSGELTELVELGKAFAGAAAATAGKESAPAPVPEPLLPEPVPDLTAEADALKANARQPVRAGLGAAGPNGVKHL